MGSTNTPTSKVENSALFGPIANVCSKFYIVCLAGQVFANFLINLLQKELEIFLSNLSKRHDDTQHNDTQHNDTQHNDTQHNDTQHNDTQHNGNQHNDTQHKGLVSDTQHK
jgi:hypothetical protein